MDGCKEANEIALRVATVRWPWGIFFLVGKKCLFGVAGKFLSYFEENCRIFECACL